MDLYQAPDGFVGTFEDVAAHEKRLGLEDTRYDVYEAPDGFRGTFEDVEAHEKRLGLVSESKDTMDVYEAPDGFRGTFEDVAAHEKRLGLVSETEEPHAKRRVSETAVKAGQVSRSPLLSLKTPFFPPSRVVPHLCINQIRWMSF
jgi:hypothetical protein